MADSTTYRVFEVVSDNDGASWSFWGVLFNLARHPHIAAGNDGTLLRAAWCTDQCFRGMVQHPGEPSHSGVFIFADAFGVPLAGEDDTFCVVQEAGEEARWVLVCKLVGGSAVSLFYSYDECRTWLFQGTMFPGGAAPVVAKMPDGTLLFAARVGNTLRGRVQYPGDLTPRGEFVFSAGATLVTVATGSGFGISGAYEGEARWLLTCVLEEPAGTFVVTDWESSSDAALWVRLT